MAVFNHIPKGEKGLKEIYQWVDDFIRGNKEIAYKMILGNSSDKKREIPAIIVTNRSIPDDQKQVAMITLARHGQEKGARIIGPEILNYLSSNDAEEIRDKQTVIVIPIFNPEGFVLNEFHSTMFGITDHEKKVLGNLCAVYQPDMMMDYHSLGEMDGSKYDHGDMEVIIPANLTKWGMDEQIYQQVANKMLAAAESKGWPYEIHTLEDLAFYYFGETATGRLPWKYLKEKVFLLNAQNFSEHYEFPEKMPGYTNYTCGPAYLKWHTLIFGIETNHWSLPSVGDIAESGIIPCQALLNMGNKRFSWEKDEGYPTNILCGDFRISIRSTGKNPGERRISREKIWKERNNFNILERKLIDPETTLAKVGYLGENFPLEINFCLRMREAIFKKVIVKNQEVEFETFNDSCSTFIYIPIVFKNAEVLNLKILHEPYKKMIRGYF